MKIDKTKTIIIKLEVPNSILCYSDEKLIKCQYWHLGKCRVFGKLESQYIGDAHMEYFKNKSCQG